MGFWTIQLCHMFISHMIHELQWLAKHSIYIIIYIYSDCKSIYTWYIIYIIDIDHG